MKEGNYNGMAVGIMETDSLVACYVAMDAASKAADVRIQNVERSRLGAYACLKLRGSISDVKAAMETAVEAAGKKGKVMSHTVIAAPSDDTEIAFYMTTSD